MKAICKITLPKGFTILEVLLAIMIIGMALLLLLNMAMVSLDSNDWSSKSTIANQMIQEKLEQLRYEPDLSSISSGSDTASGISRTWTVTDIGSYLRKIEVTVIW
ncbi:MAG: prepilin-type N-terminal cleavage/methylation domain-containing protein, partial [Candidatus Zixiibacteriota bacterium]